MEDQTITVPLPAGFDPRKHGGALVKFIASNHGEGWEVSGINLEQKVAYAVRRAAMVQVSATDSSDEPEAIEVNGLPPNTKPTDGDKWAAKLARQHLGYHMVKFDPFLGKATLAKLTEDEYRCRSAVAVALGVKPWDVLVRARRDGGFDLNLPKTYVPSKHDAKLTEVAETVVGKFGWYVKTDPAKLTATIIPSDPPTFPEIIPLNLKKLGTSGLDRTPFGMKLPEPGQKVGETAYLDWTMSPYMLLGGLPRAGKTVSLTSILADAIASGYELVIVDTPDKSVDFTWAKPYVRDGGWGCDGLRSSVTALRLAHAELKRRADILKERGVENWYRLPEKERFKPILVVVDEVSMLLMTDRLPAGVDKNTPEVQEIIQRNLLKFRIQKTIYDIMAEMGFVGARVILSSQVTNAATGLPPTMKALIGNKGLQGSNPSKSQRDQAFNVAAQVPVVPENLRGGGMAAKGVGAAEFEGQEPFIYKPSFAPVKDITAYLNTLNLRRTTRPEPTEAEMDFHCPLGDSDDFEDDVQPLVVGDRTPSGKPLDPKFGPGPAAYGADGKKLKGAAAAAHGSKALAEGGPVTVTRLPLCPSCERPIRPDGECGCS